MSAFDSDEEDDLPERIIVVQESVSAASGELEALVAEVAAVEDAPPSDDEVAVAGPAIDLDEVDLRAEHKPLEADQAWLDALSADDDDLEGDDVDEEPVEVIELAADRDDLGALAAEVASEQVDLDLDEDRQALDELASEVVARRTPGGDDGGPTTAPFRWPDEGATGGAEALRWPPRDDEPTLAEALQWPPRSAQEEDTSWVPARDETGPGTLRPKVPEPVIAARTISPPSRSRRTIRRLRALLVLVLVVLVAGVALAGAIGAAVLLVVLALSRAFGSGP